MLRERWIGWRNALLASPRFQRAALRFPPTRAVSRAHAGRLFDLVAGFTYSQVLFACVELDVFGRLAAGPAAIDDLAPAVALPPAALDRLVDAAIVLGLLERVGSGRVALGVAGAALAGNPGVAAMIAHHRHLYADLADPVGLLRRPGGGALAGFWDYARGGDSAAVAEYSALMGESSRSVAEQALDAYDVRRHRRLLDVGGGEGRFLAEVRRRAPKLELGLFDLPAVVERARVRLGAAATFHPGDFRNDPLPSGYDCVSLVRVLHDHDDPVALELLRAIRAVLPTGGTLLIAEPMRDAPVAERVGAAYFGMYLLAMGSGRARSPAMIGAMLTEAGFRAWRPAPTRLPLVAGVIVATV